MRSFLLLALVALLSVACSAQSSSSTGSASTATFCELYSGTTTDASIQIALITNITGRAALGGLFPVSNGSLIAIPGLFNASGPLYNIFTGATQYRTSPPNYVANTNPVGSTGTLVTHLVGYFGALFGCRAAGYTAVNRYDMYAVHRNMNVTQAMETYFNNQLALTLLSYGVAVSDINTMAAPALGLFGRCGGPYAPLNSTANIQICGTPDCALATGATTASCLTYYPQTYASSSSSTAGSSGAAGQFTGVALVSAALAAVVALVL